MKQFVVSEKQSLKNFTDNRCASASFYFRTLLKNRDIRVNGKRVGSDVFLSAGDTVQYFLTPAQEQKRGFDLIYEDANVLVADKESGVNSEAVFSDLRERGETYFIHRLDRNTAGLLIFAKTQAAEKELLCAFREKRIEKIYYARVVGKPTQTHAVEEAYLTKDEKSALVKVSAKPIGEKMITEYELLESDGETSLLKITLHTGKTHQIRAHTAYLGFPVAGDTKYGDRAFNRKHHLTRQKLVAAELCVRGGGTLSYLSDLRFRSEKISETL